MVEKVYHYVNGEFLIKNESKLAEFRRAKERGDVRASPVFAVPVEGKLYKYRIYYPSKESGYRKLYISVNYGEEYVLYEIDLGEVVE